MRAVDPRGEDLRLYAGVHRWSPTPAPARWTTASTPASEDDSSSRWAGSHRISAAVRGSRRTRRRTSWPRAVRWADSALPIRPEAPVIATRAGMVGPLRGRVRDRDRGLEGAVLEAVLHRRPGSARRRRRRRAGGRRTAPGRPSSGSRSLSPAVGVRDHDRALDDRAGAEDADLRLVDDRGVEQRAPAAGVGQRERAAGRARPGVTLLVRVRSARSAILRAMPAMLRSPASRMTGTSRPRSVSTAMPRLLRVVVGDDARRRRCSR